MGMPVELLGQTNLTLVGTAASAATGAGLFDDLFAAADAVAQPVTLVEPDLAAHARYGELLQDYLEATELLAPLSRKLASRQLEGPR